MVVFGLLLLLGRLSGLVELERKGVLSGWILELRWVSKSKGLAL